MYIRLPLNFYLTLKKKFNYIFSLFLFYIWTNINNNKKKIKKWSKTRPHSVYSFYLLVGTLYFFKQGVKDLQSSSSTFLSFHFLSQLICFCCYFESRSLLRYLTVYFFFFIFKIKMLFYGSKFYLLFKHVLLFIHF